MRPGSVARFGAGAVGVAGDHVRGVDPQVARQLGRGVDAAAADRGGGEVGLEIGVQQAVEQPDAGRHPGGEGGLGDGAADGPAVAGAGERAPGAFGGPARAGAEAGFGEAVEEAVDRTQDALVVGRGGGIGRLAGEPHHGRRGQAFEARQAHVAVHVVAVGGVDVLAQPDPRVGDAELGLAQPGADSPRRLALQRGPVLEPQLATGERHLFEQRLGQAVVVVTGDEHDPAPRHRPAQLLEERLGQLQHPRQRQLAQLERVAEQDEAVGAGDLLQQRAADRRVQQQVLAGGRAEVQVGDDRRAHPRNLACRRGVQRFSIGWLHGQSCG